MAFFSAIAAAAGAVFTAATTTAVGKILTGVAVNALASALFAPSAPGRVSNPILDKGQLGIVARSFIVGTYATKGSIVYRNSYGTGSDDPTEKLVVVYALSDLPVRGLSRMWINGQECSLRNGTPGPRGWVIPEFNYDGKAKAYYKFYDGTQTVADPELVDHVSSEGRPWTSEHVGHGVAYLILYLDHDPRVWTTGRPDVLFEVDGYRFRDPSTGAMGTGDGLPAVQMHGILSGIEYAGQWFYGPQKPAVLPTSNWAKAVEDCRQKVPGASSWTTAQRNAAFRDGTVPARYASGMEVSVDRPVSEVCQDLATACNGRFAEVAGTWKFQVGNPPPVSAAAFTFSDDDISTLDGQTFSPFLPLAETVNHFTGTYPDPEQQYNMQEAPALRVAAYEKEDGDRQLTSNVQFNAVTAKEQIQRLMKSALAEARRARRHTITLGSKFFGVEPGDYGAWDSQRNGYIRKLFRVDGIRDEANGSVTLDLTETDPTDYDFDGPDFQVVSSGSIVRPAEPTYIVPNFTVTGHVIPDEAGFPRRAAIRLSWDTDRRGRGIAYRVYPRGRNEIVTRGTTMEFEAGSLVTADGIVGGKRYEVQARRLTKAGKTPWTARMPVTAPDIKLSEDELSQKIRDDLASAEAAADELDALAAEKGKRLLEVLADIQAGEIDQDAVYQFVRDQTSAAREGAQAYTDQQILSFADDEGGLAARVQDLQAAYVANTGFEAEEAYTAGEPIGWKLQVATGNDRAVRYHGGEIAPDSKGKRSFGSQDATAGPWWYLSKTFRWTRGQNIRCIVNGWVAAPGSNPAPTSDFVGEDDFFIHWIYRNETGGYLGQSSTWSGVYSTWRATGKFSGGWHKADSTRTGPDDVAYVEVRIVAADANGANVNKLNYSNFSGNAAVLFDDIEFSSDNGVLIEVDPFDLDRALSANARFQTIEQLQVDRDTAFGQYLQKLGVQSNGNNAGTIAEGLAFASEQGAKSKYVLTATAGNAKSTFRILATDNLDGNPVSTITFGADYYRFDGGLALFGPQGVRSDDYIAGTAGAGFKIDSNGAEFGTLALRNNSITLVETTQRADLISNPGGTSGTSGGSVSHFGAQNYLTLAVTNHLANYDLFFWINAVGQGIEINISFDDNAGCFRGTEFLTRIGQITSTLADTRVIQGVALNRSGHSRIRLHARRLDGSTDGYISSAATTLLARMR